MLGSAAAAAERWKEGRQRGPAPVLVLALTGVAALAVLSVAHSSRHAAASGSIHLAHRASVAPERRLLPGSSSAGAGSWRSGAVCNDSANSAHLDLMKTMLNPHAVLEQLLQEPGQTWVQIGANTLDSHNINDPLKKLLDRVPTWHKVFVEPIPQLFERLQQSVKRWPNSTALNLAVSPDPSVGAATQATMWCLAEGFNTSRLGKDLPIWANQICSFNASHIPWHFPNRTGVAVNVTAVSLPELLRRAGVTHGPRVLLIDTEGLDYDVLRQIDFARMRPTFVMWEHKHLRKKRPEAVAFMKQHCYAVWKQVRENTIAISMFV